SSSTRSTWSRYRRAWGPQRVEAPHRQGRGCPARRRGWALCWVPTPPHPGGRGRTPPEKVRGGHPPRPKGVGPPCSPAGEEGVEAPVAVHAPPEPLPVKSIRLVTRAAQRDAQFRGRRGRVVRVSGKLDQPGRAVGADQGGGPTNDG